MKRFLKHFLATWAICLIGIGCTGAQAEETRSDFERSFIGQEWPMTAYTDGRYALTRPCIYQGGGMSKNQQSVPDFGLTYLECHRDGAWLMLFEAVIGREGRGAVVRILDAVQLPAPKPGERYWSTGECELNGNANTEFIAIAPKRLRREKVDWKTGVRLAWLPNMETGKIEPLSTRHIVCWRPTPP